MKRSDPCGFLNYTITKLHNYPIEICFWLAMRLESWSCHLTRQSRPLTISDISLSIKHLVPFPQSVHGSLS
jgi:hypothetical protein